MRWFLWCQTTDYVQMEVQKKDSLRVTEYVFACFRAFKSSVKALNLCMIQIPYTISSSVVFQKEF